MEIAIALQTPETKAVIVAMLSLFLICFQVGWAPLNYIIMGEVPEQRLRDKSQRVGSWVNIATKYVVPFKPVRDGTD
jgi:hypothetical protein